MNQPKRIQKTQSEKRNILDLLEKYNWMKRPVLGACSFTSSIQRSSLAHELSFWKTLMHSFQIYLWRSLFENFIMSEIITITKEVKQPLHHCSPGVVYCELPLSLEYFGWRSLSLKTGILAWSSNLLIRSMWEKLEHITLIQKKNQTID